MVEKQHKSEKFTSGNPWPASKYYYPYGMVMDERNDVVNGTYRYGFNGKEKDDEGMGGCGQTYDYGFRIYNPALGKFLSVDPLTRKYAMLTPYQFASICLLQQLI
jgi:RHS repeat-associated protein